MALDSLMDFDRCVTILISLAILSSGRQAHSQTCEIVIDYQCNPCTLFFYDDVDGDCIKNVKVVDGAYFDGGLHLSDHTTLTISGGYVYNVDVHDDASVTMTGGEASFIGVETGGSATIFDGVLDRLWTMGAIVVEGGSIGELDSALEPIIVTGGTVEFNNGSASSLIASNVSRIDWNGGTLSGRLRVEGRAKASLAGGSVGEISTQGVIEVENGFFIDGHAVESGPVEASEGQITGALSTGEWLDTPFEQGGSGFSRVTLVPEPSSEALVLASTLTIALVYRRRRAAA